MSEFNVRTSITLSERNRARLDAIKENVRTKWSNARASFVRYPPHDDSHSEKLEELLATFFSEDGISKINNVFSDDEKFLLLAAIWLHDVGMCPELFQDDPGRTTSKDDLTEWEKRVLRKDHHKRSEKYTLLNRENLRLSDTEARRLAGICFLHRKSQKIPREGLDDKIRLIIAYLRLLDAFHVPDRVPLGDLRTNLAYGIDPASKFHWYKSFYVLSIEPSPDKLQITIKFKMPREWGKRELEKMSPLVNMVDMEIRDELDAVKNVLIEGRVKYDLPAYIYISHDFEPTSFLNSEIDEFEELLGITALFDPTISPNSGKVINIVLDNIERSVEDPEPGVGVGKLRAYLRDTLKPLLEERPCHVYLRKVYEKLQSISDPKTSACSTSHEDILDKTKTIVKALKEKRSMLPKELPPKVLNETKLCADDTILLYGYSSSVIMVFNALSPDVKNSVNVVVCECSTKTKHRFDNRLVYCDGLQYLSELRKKGIKRIHYVPDVSASNLFSRGIYDEGKDRFDKITKVFFGVNGIDKERSVAAHGLGHLAIVDMAKTYEVPVYVIAESMKIGAFEETPKKMRKEPWHPTDVSFEDINELEGYNPREDVVSVNVGNFRAVITEKGSFPQMNLEAISSDIDEIIEDTERK